MSRRTRSLFLGIALVGSGLFVGVCTYAVVRDLSRIVIDALYLLARG